MVVGVALRQSVPITMDSDWSPQAESSPRHWHESRPAPRATWPGPTGQLERRSPGRERRRGPTSESAGAAARSNGVRPLP